MFEPGEVISHAQMCHEEGISLQKGMNFHHRANLSVILMSVRPGAPYADRVEDNGRVLIYEGHDISRSTGGPDPKTVDQPMKTRSGHLTPNGKFFEAARTYRATYTEPEYVRVYEKIRGGIWVYAGVFRLVDAWQEPSGGRSVFKFRLEVSEEEMPAATRGDLEHNRIIPTTVKRAVWNRDNGQCVKCGSRDNLHFDHDIPYSRGGSSLVAENIQLLCARHNLEKRDRIE